MIKLHKWVLPTRQALHPQPPRHQSDVHPNEPLRSVILFYVPTERWKNAPAILCHQFAKIDKFCWQKIASRVSKLMLLLLLGWLFTIKANIIHTQTYTKILLGCCPHDYHWQIKLNCMFVWKIYVMVIYSHADLVTVTSECCVKRFPVKPWLGLSIQHRPRSDVEKQGIWAGSVLFV